MRRFIFTNKKSNKFWNIEVEDDTLITHFGRIGTNGQQSIKSFGSNEQANKEANKLIKSKMKKGYIEQ